MQVLAIGLKEQENEELGRWQETRGFKAWFAATALAGLRVFEEFEPDVFRQLIEYIHTGCVTLQPRTLLGNSASTCVKKKVLQMELISG